MLARPILEFDLKKIKENAAKLKKQCDKYGIMPSMAVKGVKSAYEIIETVMEAGITHFGDSRIMNIRRLKERHPEVYMMLIRTPAPQEAEEVVRWCDSSIHSEAETVMAISEAARALGKVHDIYLDIDVGDIRDGIFGTEQLDEFMDQVVGLPGINFLGVLANVGCVGSVMPDRNNTQQLADCKDYLNRKYGLNIKYVSFGGTVAYQMIVDGQMPEGVNEFRFGEAVFFGEDTTGNRDLEGFHKDAVIFAAPVVEVRKKPSVPIGQLGLDACGNVGVYIDRGIRKRVILAAGKQDVDCRALTLIDPGMIYIGSSSDHIIVDVEEAESEVKLGDYIRFRCGYMAMLSASTSEFVEKVYLQ